MTLPYAPIGHLTTPFKEKFGVPRQSLMMTEARGILKLRPDPQFAAALTHLEQFSHVWLIFDFHKTGDWHPLIDTPRVDAGEKIGVFATRSPHRPNSIGMSVAKLEKIDLEARGGIEIHLSGLDILDGTPVLDIKPYVPYADAVGDANSGWIKSDIERHAVEFSDAATATLERVSEKFPNVRALVQQMLELDPRPTSQRRAFPIGDAKTESQRFAFRVLDVDVRWRVSNRVLHVFEIVEL